MRPAQDSLIFESVIDGVVLANKENSDPNDPKLEPRAMVKPRGVFPFYADNYSSFGRAPFEVQSVDAGWLLEHTSGAPLGYIHVEWSVHLPKKPELDPCIGLHGTLHEIVLRPCVRGLGLGNMMVDTCVKAIEHHANLLPWQVLAKKRSAVLKVIPIDSNVSLSLLTK
jgi:ribosomal protein S18 acetylase RimI-like enzyme